MHKTSQSGSKNLNLSRYYSFANSYQDVAIHATALIQYRVCDGSARAWSRPPACHPWLIDDHHSGTGTGPVPRLEPQSTPACRNIDQWEVLRTRAYPSGGLCSRFPAFHQSFHPMVPARYGFVIMENVRFWSTASTLVWVGNHCIARN